MFSLFEDKTKSETDENKRSGMRLSTDINGHFSPSIYALPIDPIDNIGAIFDHCILSGEDSGRHYLFVDKNGNLRFSVMDDSLIGMATSKHIILNKEWITSSFDLYTGFIYDVAHLFEDNSFLYIGYNPRSESRSEGTFLFRVSVDGHIIWQFKIEGYLKYMHSIPVDKDGNTYLFANHQPKSPIASHRFYKISHQGECLVKKELDFFVEKCLFLYDGNIIAHVRHTNSIDGGKTYKICLFNSNMEFLNELQNDSKGPLNIDYKGNVYYNIGPSFYSFDKNLKFRWKVDEEGQVYLRPDNKTLILRAHEILCVDCHGSINWSKELPIDYHWFIDTLIVDKNNYFIAFGDSMFGDNTHVVCFSPDGEIVWKALLNKKTYGQAAILYGDRMLYVAYGIDIKSKKYIIKNRWNKSLVIRTFIDK